MRVLAIDLGDARTGLAVSDALGILCGEAWTVKEWNRERLAETVCRANGQECTFTLTNSLLLP